MGSYFLRICLSKFFCMYLVFLLYLFSSIFCCEFPVGDDACALQWRGICTLPSLASLEQRYETARKHDVTTFLNVRNVGNRNFAKICSRCFAVSFRTKYENFFSSYDFYFRRKTCARRLFYRVVKYYSYLLLVTYSFLVRATECKFFV